MKAGEFNRDFGLTIEQAKRIKYWRCVAGYTWRAVAREVANNFEDLGVHSGNQIDGMKLCDEAMSLLKEKVSQGWN